MSTIIMKTAYCSLKDAFKAPEFSKQEEIMIEDTQLPQPPQLHQEPKEEFKGECEYIQHHLKRCSACNHAPDIDIAFNDILNMILIVLMIWIIIYKPTL